MSQGYFISICDQFLFGLIEGLRVLSLDGHMFVLKTIIDLERLNIFVFQYFGQILLLGLDVLRSLRNVQFEIVHLVDWLIFDCLLGCYLLLLDQLIGFLCLFPT